MACQEMDMTAVRSSASPTSTNSKTPSEDDLLKERARLVVAGRRKDEEIARLETRVREAESLLLKLSAQVQVRKARECVREAVLVLGEADDEVVDLDASAAAETDGQPREQHQQQSSPKLLNSSERREMKMNAEDDVGFNKRELVPGTESRSGSAQLAASRSSSPKIKNFVAEARNLHTSLDWNQSSRPASAQVEPPPQLRNRFAEPERAGTFPGWSDRETGERSPTTATRRKFLEAQLQRCYEDRARSRTRKKTRLAGSTTPGRTKKLQSMNDEEDGSTTFADVIEEARSTMANISAALSGISSVAAAAGNAPASGAPVVEEKGSFLASKPKAEIAQTKKAPAKNPFIFTAGGPRLAGGSENSSGGTGGGPYCFYGGEAPRLRSTKNLEKDVKKLQVVSSASRSPRARQLLEDERKARTSPRTKSKSPRSAATPPPVIESEFERVLAHWQRRSPPRDVASPR
mmetsp:Transcript_10657/g.26090  ORF Transcript_10657/g.26090 Transcript_10657/m.26090 type:complete len:463 (-) Transcript_10657:93-1481(-)